MNRPELQLGTPVSGSRGGLSRRISARQILFAAAAMAAASCGGGPIQEVESPDLAGYNNTSADMASAVDLASESPSPDGGTPVENPDMTTLPPCNGLFIDTDGDGIPNFDESCNVVDICPFTPGTPDVDGDDVCDGDSNGDGGDRKKGLTLDRDTAVLLPGDNCVGEGSEFYNPFPWIDDNDHSKGKSSDQPLARGCMPDGGVDLGGLPADAFSDAAGGEDGGVDGGAGIDAGTADLATLTDLAESADLIKPADLATKD